MAKGISVIGSGVRAAQCALTLAEMGIDVHLVTPSLFLEFESNGNSTEPSHELLHVWPLLLRAASHPKVKLITNSRVKSLSGKQGNLLLKVTKKPRYVSEETCTGCGKCEEECSVKVQSQSGGRKSSHAAIHSPVIGLKTVPSAYYIEKEGVSPCRSDCPLGINVQGYIALIAKGKIDKARALINEVAPMAGILGRLCTHLCESNCARGRIDSPVFIKALHRFAADNSNQSIVYERKAPAGSHKEKIAIIGSGPAGLTAAWELARRGYTPTIFESHSVVGGMLATGIPRFRLPREIREREVEAIKAMGVDIKTGVTVGRDVMYSDLIDRGYKAFFLAIGAQQNNKLNVPGEDLNGVLDCISLLFSLNLKVGVSVGSEVVVIGGGNSAVDSARSAKRVSKGDVRILCLTEQMTAIQEDVEEAVKEGIIIDYNVTVVEILGDGNNVTGVRCQRVKNVTFEPDGRINMEYIPDSDFSVKADRVVVSIGQKPNSPALNIKNLGIGNNNNKIKADPLTLETGIPGVFAGGDSVTGSNSVVMAMASGLRAAESIDRYLKSHDLKKGRTIEKPVPVQVNLDERKPSPYKRAHVPILPFSKRKGNYEETNLGLAEEIAKREAARCLNCSICCECLECEQACELKAINHKDTEKQIDLEIESIINFVSPEKGILELNKPGVRNITEIGDKNVPGELAEASAIALSAAVELQSKDIEKSVIKGLVDKLQIPNIPLKDRTVVFLCRCGDSISSVLDFDYISQAIFQLRDVYSIQEINQACTYEGSQKIKAYLEKENVAHAVLAACRCCNLEQICFSCSDRRVMCQNNLLDIPQGVNVEYVNIREQCAWIHKDDPEGATGKAIDLISTGVTRAQKLLPVIYETKKVTGGVLILGNGLSSLAAACRLVNKGYDLHILYEADADNSKKQTPEYKEYVAKLLDKLAALNVKIQSWPQTFELNGTPGRYEAVIAHDSRTKKIEIGAVIIDIIDPSKEKLEILARSNIINRVINRQHHFSRVSSLDSTLVHSFTVRETAGIFNVVPAGTPSTIAQAVMGEAAAARVLMYLAQEQVKPRSSSVVINSKLCRGCGDCIKLCPYIEMKTKSKDLYYASIDPALCFGCGACISVCPTGAIKQPLQSEIGVVAALQSLLRREESTIQS